MYVQMPLNNFNMALGTFVGQNIGAGKKERIAVGVRQTLILSLTTTVVMSAVVFLFQDQIIRLFALGSDAAFYCHQHLTLIAAAFLLQSVYLPLCGVFQGAGDGFAVTRTAVFAHRTQKRILKDSAFWYRNVIHTNGTALEGSNDSDGFLPIFDMTDIEFFSYE